MKNILIFLALSVSSATYANQSIACREINRDGSVKKKGRTIGLNLKSNKDGSLNADKSRIKLKGFAKRNEDSLLESLTIISLNESEPDSKNAYATLFLDDPEGMLDVQLQFKSRILGYGFTSRRATFVIGSDDANPETGFAFGFDVTCRSRLLSSDGRAL